MEQLKIMVPLQMQVLLILVVELLLLSLLEDSLIQVHILVSQILIC